MDKPLVFLLSRQRHCRVAMFGMDNRWKHLSGKPTTRLDFPKTSVFIDSFETRTLIGGGCKWGNSFSRAVLIGLLASLFFLSRKNNSSLCSSGEFQKSRTYFVRNDLNWFWRVTCISKWICYSTFEDSVLLVSLAAGPHLIPSRTQKLSPPAAMVVQWWHCGRVARCQLFFRWRRKPNSTEPDQEIDRVFLCQKPARASLSVSKTRSNRIFAVCNLRSRAQIVVWSSPAKGKICVHFYFWSLCWFLLLGSPKKFLAIIVSVKPLSIVW